MTKERRTIPVMPELPGAPNCPLAPPEHASVQSRAMHRACLILGGMEQLSRHLDVPADAVRRWLKGDEIPPEPVLLACVEVILLYATGTGAAN